MMKFFVVLCVVATHFVNGLSVNFNNFNNENCPPCPASCAGQDGDDETVHSEGRTKVALTYPIYNNNGKPDLTIDPQRFHNQADIVDRLFTEDDCAWVEGAVNEKGVRRLLRFDVAIINGGDGDLIIGKIPDDNNPLMDHFIWSPCHGHYHMMGFSIYQLLDLNGNEVTKGHKQGYCLMDILKYDGVVPEGGKWGPRGGSFGCNNQGIHSGWGDLYNKGLDGQWIDITDVPAGDYILKVTINLETAAICQEGENRYPNTIQQQVKIPDPRNKVTFDTTKLTADKTKQGSAHSHEHTGHSHSHEH